MKVEVWHNSNTNHYYYVISDNGKKVFTSTPSFNTAADALNAGNDHLKKGHGVVKTGITSTRLQTTVNPLDLPDYRDQWKR